jgi:hypothetical protein
MLKITEMKTVGFNKDITKGAMNLRLSVVKLDDGTYKADVIGQNASATGPTSEDAIRAAKALFKDTFEQGKQAPRHTS